uniref:Ecotropic viral integration site 5a n=1 Tax=Sinocyclocheilus grahami TaxID=75366 RepID=A0A672T8G4_SINGR
MLIIHLKIYLSKVCYLFVCLFILLTFSIKPTLSYVLQIIYVYLKYSCLSYISKYSVWYMNLRSTHKIYTPKQAIFLNRLLETDRKSLYPLNGVLQSPTSPKTFSFDDDIWGNVIKEWDDWRKRKVGQIKVLIRRGVPAHLRPAVWQLLCDAQNVAVRQKYSDLLKSSSPSETLILRDLTRILPQHQLFHNKAATCQKPLFNVLKAYSILDREIGYCQGSVFIVGLLLTQMAEEEAFYIFVRLMKDFRMRDLYRSNMVELGCCIHQFDAMIKDQLPELHSHFQTQGFQTSVFSSSWFLNILLSSLPIRAAIRIFDIFMCEGLEIVFRVGLALLHMKQTELIKLDVEGMMNVMEHLNETTFLFSFCLSLVTAYQIKYNPSRMKQYVFSLFPCLHIQLSMQTK